MTYMRTEEVLMAYGMPAQPDPATRDDLVAAEAWHLCRCIVGVARDTNRDGTTRGIALDTEVAHGLIENEPAIKQLVRLVAAERCRAFTVTDAELARVVREAVLAEIDKLADHRVAA